MHGLHIKSEEPAYRSDSARDHDARAERHRGECVPVFNEGGRDERHLLHEPAVEPHLRVGGQVGERAEEFGAVSVDQLRVALVQIDVLVERGPREVLLLRDGDLYADELRAGVPAVFVEPVRVHQARRVLRRVRGNRLKKCVFVGHERFYAPAGAAGAHSVAESRRSYRRGA